MKLPEAQNEGSTWETLCLGGSIIPHSLRDVSFIHSNWMNTMASDESKTQFNSFKGTATTLYEKSSVIQRDLAMFLRAAQGHMKDKDGVFELVHSEIVKLAESSEMRYFPVVVSYRDIAARVFKHAPLKVDQSQESIPSVLTVATDPSISRQVGPSELLAAFFYLNSLNGSSAYVPHITLKTDLRRHGLFRVLDERYKLETEWLATELSLQSSITKTANIRIKDIAKQLRLQAYSPGRAIRGFVQKMHLLVGQSKSSDSSVARLTDSLLGDTVPNIKFCEEDRIIVESALAASLSASFESRRAKLFFELQRVLEGHRIIEPKTPLKVGAVRLLKMAGYWSPWHFGIAESVTSSTCPPVMSGFGNILGDITTRESLKAAYDLLKGQVRSGQDVVESFESMLIKPNPESKLLREGTKVDTVDHLRREFGPEHTVYVIDSATAHELDDGLSIEPVLDTEGNVVDHWLHVHIADPTADIAPNDPLAYLSQIRGSSVYLPGIHHPMMPDILSDKIFNLQNGCKALTFSVRVAQDGEISDWKVTPSVLRNVKICTYDMANTALDSSYVLNADNSRLSPWSVKFIESLKKPKNLHASFSERDVGNLRAIQRIVERHVRYRCKNGALLQDSPSVSLNVTPYPSSFMQRPISTPFYASKETRPVVHLGETYSNTLSISQIVVSESMILAGRVAAKFCSERGLLVPYRGQPSIFESADENEYPYALLPFKSLRETDKSSLKSMFEMVQASKNENGVIPTFDMIPLFQYFQPAMMDLRPISHFAMGLPGVSPMDRSEFKTGGSKMVGYVKATSPLRRYSDMLVHWQIKAALSESKPVFGEMDLRRLIPYLKEVDTKVNIVSKRFEKSWVVEFCRRRELIHKMTRRDPLVEQSYKGAFGVGLPSIEGFGPLKGISYRSAEEVLKAGSLRYTGIISTTMCKADSISKRMYLTNVMIMELGCEKVNVLLTPETKRDFQVGEMLECVVLRADPDTGVLTMVIVPN